MSHNPYQPPGSVVADAVEPKAAMPRAVKIALLLLWIKVAFVVYGALTAWPAVNRGDRSPLGVLGELVFAGMLAALCLLLARRRSWARWALLALGLLLLLNFLMGLVSLLWGQPAGVKLQPDYFFMAREILRIAGYLLAAYLLLFPGRAYFRPRA